MDVIIQPGVLSGTIPAIASKSMAHRLLICASLCPGPTDIACDSTSADIDATVSCLNALGAHIVREAGGFHVEPIPGTGATDNIRLATPMAELDCGESGSTLRFLLPVTCALGRGARIVGHGRITSRPLSPLYEELVAGGCELSEWGVSPLVVGGRLRAGRFELPGDVSSQFVSGLLLAAPLLAGPSEVIVHGTLQSRPYVDLTRAALARFGVLVHEEECATAEGPLTRFLVSPSTPFRSPGEVEVEGDWSNAAPWLAAGALAGPGVGVSGLDLSSSQGDRTMLAVLARLGAKVTRQGNTAAAHHDRLVGCDIDAMDFPDLVPAIAVVAALADGRTTIHNVERLRLKESDRVESVVVGLAALGARIASSRDSITIEGVRRLDGGTVDSHNDHRIAMMGAIAAIRCAAPVTIIDSGCVTKSYPAFFEDYAALGGKVTQREG
jgi:3-phosphoshikimate 1-carboxyvinyltransferase